MAESIVINEINIRSADRSNKDIATWRGALRAAESTANPSRTHLYDLYDEVLLDGHLTGVIAKKINAVLNKELYFEKNGERIAAMDDLIHSQPFRTVVQTIVETLLWGVSAIEFVPGPQLAVHTLPRKHIRPEKGLITWEQGGNDGIAYKDRNNIWVLGTENDLGLLLKCAPYVLYKRGCLADWAQFIEVFGQPVRIIRYDSYDDQTRAELNRILNESGSSLSLMLPRQADFEVLDGKQTNSDGGLQLSFIKALNEEISVTVLGNTETTNSSHSAGYAQSKIHQEQQNEISKADIAWTTALLNSAQFMTILNSYGYAVTGGRFAFRKDMDVAYLQQRIAIDRELATHIGIPDSYWQYTYGIPTGGR